MMTGIVTYELVPKLTITLVGAGMKELQVIVDLDTGFNGGLSLPIGQIQSLGWNFWRRDEVTLGDGSTPEMEFYRSLVMWHGQPRLVTVLSAEARPLIGTGLLDGNELKIQFQRGGSVSIAPIP